MSKSRIRSGLVMILFCLVISACSNDAEDNEGSDNQVPEVNDEQLFSVIESNVDRLMAKDLEGYMETIHSDSPVYETTSETAMELFNYTLEIGLEELEVKEKNEEEAVVAYKQRTIEREGKDFQNNETVGEHTLRLDNGEWRIFESNIIEVIPILEEEADEVPEVEMTGDYADDLMNLHWPFDEENWVLASYIEAEGEAAAEYIPAGENLGNYSQMITYDFYENGNELSGLAHFISILQLSLEEMTDGELNFTRLYETESVVEYHFTLSEDTTQPDQEEIGRIFILDNDIYIVRYTVMKEEIENRDEIITLLREIQDN